MMQQIMGVTMPASNKSSSSHVSQQQFDEWASTATFIVLQGQRLGQNFCNTFMITDAFLYYSDSSLGQLKQYIKENYIK